MVNSPYKDIPSSEWREITSKLIKKHPLGVDDIRELSIASWSELWQTSIGSGDSAFLLAEINPPAQVIGYLFEKLFLRSLMARFPNQWRGPQNRTEKDLVYDSNQDLSIELKTSGQLGLRIFGNRSYAQSSTSAEAKGKSGYYLTINFFEKSLNLIRFGWIDHSDWKPQFAPTGQMAGLGEDVYLHKLVTIHGEYQLQAPLELLRGVGAGLREKLHGQSIKNIADLLDYSGTDARILLTKAAAKQFLGK